MLLALSFSVVSIATPQSNFEEDANLLAPYCDVGEVPPELVSYVKELLQKKATYEIVKFCEDIKNIKDELAKLRAENNELRSTLESSNERITQLLQENEALNAIASIDSLTGLRTRRSMEEDWQSYQEKRRESKKEFFVAILDLDFFKKVNDRYGHIVGDEVLKTVGSIIVNRLRETDRIYRYGGEEIIVMLEAENDESALKVFEELLILVKAHKFTAFNTKTKTTDTFSNSFSMGVAKQTKIEQKLEELIDLADNALYQAKDNGRSQIVFYNNCLSSLN